MIIKPIKLVQRIVTIALVALLTNCGGLPDEDKQKAQLIPATLNQAKQLIVKKNKSNQEFLDSASGKALKAYAIKEKWDQFFNQATLELQQAESIYQKTIIPIIERDDEKDIVNIRVAMVKMNRYLAKARVSSAKASMRKDFLLSTIKNAPTLITAAETNIKMINSLLTVSQTYTDKPISDYPAKKEDINKRYQALNLLRDKAIQSLILAKAEFEKINSNSANYAILGDGAKNISDTLLNLATAVPALKAKLDELYRSYSKTLADMRIDYFVQIGRTSWDNYSDYASEHNYIYTSQVSSEVANYIDGLSDGIIASGNNRGSISIKIDTRMWSALKIAPTESWPSSSDDSSEFWVSNIIFKYYHKYLITENQKQTETQWQLVKSDYFLKNEQNLGLTIVSKPYGMYEEETINSAAPPGMEYIAKPIMVNGQATGKNQYGEWKQDSSGSSFWQYYATYSFMRMILGGSSYTPYSYNDWTHYSNRKGNTGYYGTGNQYGTYGSSTYNNSRYKSSSYSRQNPGVTTASGREKMKSASSVRNSGPRTRSKGPSGGGK